MKKIIEFFKHPTSKNIIINSLGNYLNLFFTAFFALILVRILDPAHYGVLNVLLGIAYVLANVLDFGTTATIYSYLPQLFHHREQKDEELRTFIKSTFFYQSLFSLIVIGLLFIFFPLLDKEFFKTGAPVWELYATSISVLFFIWQNFIMNIFFAVKKFLRANVYLNISNLIKTIVIFLMKLYGVISVGNVIVVFGILGPLIFFALVFFEKKAFIFRLATAKIKKEEFRFGYTLTYFLASQFFNLAQRMDLFLLSHFGLKNEAGYYGLAQKIILTVITTVISITQVISPIFSSIKVKKDVIPHIRSAFWYLLLPTGLFTVLCFVPDVLFSITFTAKYTAAAPLTRILALPFILFSLSSIPMLFLLYTVKKPKYILAAYIAFFIIVTGGCYFFIPVYGVIAAPYSILCAFIVTAIMLTIPSIYEYKHMPDLLAEH